MKGLYKNENCCGCTACYSICKYNAIKMTESKKGFLEPEINEKLCKNCDMCREVCPLQKDIFINEQEFYAARSKSEIKLRKSQSGGAFFEIAEHVINRCGVVYGVILDKNKNAVYDRADSIRKVKQMRGSKYVQSEVNNTFLKVSDDLKSGKLVLFSGTACVVHGLKCFLERDNNDLSNLLTVDIICHGVSSPKLFKEYKDLFCKLHTAKRISRFNFRDKRFGWQGPTVIGVDGKNYVNNGYMNYYYSSYALRDSCYSCHYANTNRPSDITIGDCWGIERIDNSLNDDLGCSLVILNTTKGKSVWKTICGEMIYISVKKDLVLQDNLIKPTSRPKDVDCFWGDYYKYGCEYALTRYCEIENSNEYEVLDKKQYFRRLYFRIKRVINCFFEQ